MKNVYFICTTPEENTYRYGYIYDSDEDEPYRSAMFNDLVSVNTLSNYNEYCRLEEESKIYIEDHADIAEALRTLMSYCSPALAERDMLGGMYNFVTDAQAANFMNENKLNHIFYTIKDEV